jgi:hypothetical protein
MTMERSEIELVLKEAVEKCANSEGWSNLAEMGSYLRSKGIKYGKLSKFLSDYEDIIETKIDDSITPPAVYAQLRESS